MGTVETQLQHKLVTQTAALYQAVPGGLFNNPTAPRWVNDQYKVATGNDPGRLGDRVIRWMEGKGYSVRTGKPADGAQGETDFEGMTVTYLPDLPPAGRVEVLLHEAGHIAADHANPDALAVRVIIGTGWAEIEAETVAYIVGGLHGFDFHCMAVPYIAGWAEGDLQAVRDFSRKVTHTAHQLSAELDAITL